jgi:AraC-like DNA-binding protein
MTATALGDLAMSRTQITPAITLRDKELAGVNKETYTFAWAEDRMLEVVQRGKALSLKRGQAAMLASDEIGQIASPNGGSYTAILLPKTDLIARFAKADQQVMQLQPATSVRLKLVTHYARLCAQAARFADARALALMGDHLLNLIALALDGQADEEAFRAHSSVAVSRVQIIRNVIERIIDDPDLSLNRLAQQCGLSPRSVQLAFEKTGTSYSDFLLNLRLDKALAMLTTDPQIRVIDVALACGFADVSYFNRRFRARFGETPTAARAITR